MEFESALPAALLAVQLESGKMIWMWKWFVYFSSSFQLWNTWLHVKGGPEQGI